MKMRVMNQYICLSLFTLFASIKICTAQSENHADAIFWNDTLHLSLSDFGRRTSSRIASCCHTIDVSDKKSGQVLIITIRAKMLRSCSEYGFTDSLPSIIDHEYVHFAIAELYARKIRKSISELSSKSYPKIIKNVNKIFFELDKEKNSIQIKYDEETNHNRNIREQKRWRTYVMEELKKYNEYKDVEVTVKLK